MVLNVTKTLPLKRIKVSRVVFMSGILTFLYCIEFSIGIRTVYFTFRAWNNSSYEPQEKPVSWALCVACLFIAVISTFSVNLLSAMWEQKQLDEREKEKSAIRFAFHIVVGGMLWRYISVWCVEKKEFQKKGALLLTMVKFMFTQTFTIPMVIVHVSVMDHLDEIIYDACSIGCISASLIFTCTMFSWCSREIEELKKWDFETVDLVPLIFQSDVSTSVRSAVKTVSDSTDKEAEADSKSEQKSRCNSKNLEHILIKIIVFFQTFGFSFGRLLALGILLKLAGIYAVSIMFLQLLISVIYLKFQTPILVSDSLPKWRQLSRLAFMSYILIFEWHLNRDPKTGYDFSSNIKHSILYYSMATLESIFYLVTWTITTNYSSDSEVSEIKTPLGRFSRIILIIGSISLLLSLAIHLVLLLWNSRRISVFIYSVRRRYETTKLRVSINRCKKDVEEKPVKRLDRAHIDISSPIPIKKNEDQNICRGRELEKHSSYRDLRDPVDEEIDLCFQKCGTHVKKKDLEEQVDSRHITMPEESKEITLGRTFVETLDEHLHNEVNKIQKNAPEEFGKSDEPATIVATDIDTSIDLKDEKKVTEKSPKTSLKSKLNFLSGSISEQWGKVTSAPSKFAGTMRDKIQKRKEQFQNFRSNSSTAEDKPETKEKASENPELSTDLNSDSSKPENQKVEECEGYFIGDDRCHQEESLQSVKSVGEYHVSFSSDVVFKSEEEGKESEDDTLPDSDTNHKVGDSPCFCYICRTLGDNRFRRRRSSSVPAADRKPRQMKEDSLENNHLSRYRSNPNIAQSRCEKKRTEHATENRRDISPAKIAKTTFSLSRLSLENRLEHYV